MELLHYFQWPHHHILQHRFVQIQTAMEITCYCDKLPSKNIDVFIVKILSELLK